MDLDAVPKEALVVALGLALVVVVVQAVRAWSVRSARRRAILARVDRAMDGERRAAAWLEARGFRVLGAQVAGAYPLAVDDVEMEIGVRADYLVEKDGARYVVEVKTGGVATRLETPATRRQLLEYLVAFDVAGVLLFDAEAERVRAVTFPEVGARESVAYVAERSWWPVWLAVIAGSACFVAWRYYAR